MVPCLAPARPARLDAGLSLSPLKPFLALFLSFARQHEGGRPQGCSKRAARPFQRRRGHPRTAPRAAAARTGRAPRAAARLGGRRGGRRGRGRGRERGRQAGRVRDLDLQHGVAGVVGAERHALHAALHQPAARLHQALLLRAHLRRGARPHDRHDCHDCHACHACRNRHD